MILVQKNYIVSPINFLKYRHNIYVSRVRNVLVYRRGIGVIPIEEAPPKELHYVQDDSMPPVFNHADGKIYDSKHAIRETYRRRGYLEVGNDKLSKYCPKDGRRNIPFADKTIMNALEKSYSQLEDPSFRRNFRERESERFERLIRDGYKT